MAESSTSNRQEPSLPSTESERRDDTAEHQHPIESERPTENQRIAEEASEDQSQQRTETERPVEPQPSTDATPARTRTRDPRTRSRRHAQPHTSSAAPPAPYPMYSYPQPTYGNPIIPFDKTWFWIKVGLTCLSITISAVLLALSLSISLGVFDGFRTPLAVIIVPVVVVAAAWDIAELVVNCARKSAQGARHGIHPGAHVGVDLVLWLACAFVAIVVGASYTSAQSTIRNCRNSMENGSDSRTRIIYYCSNDAYELYTYQGGVYVNVLVACMAFVTLLALTHFGIFVRACVETHIRNSTKVVVMVPSVYGPPQQGMVPYPNAYPMMPMQTHMGPLPEPRVIDEKQAERNRRAQDRYTSLAGFYAPMSPVSNPPPHRAEPRRDVEATASGS